MNILLRAVMILIEHARQIERKLDLLLSGQQLPQELVKAGQDLEEKRKALQSAIDAQSTDSPEQPLKTVTTNKSR